MKYFKYVGKEQQLLDKGFRIQIDQDNDVYTKIAWRDFKCKTESVVILLYTDNRKEEKFTRLVRALYNNAENHHKIKHEIMDLIDDNLVKVEDVESC